MFAANIPFKVALFAALTGHEYQAEGAEGAADATTTVCRCRLLRAPSDLILSLLSHGMSVFPGVFMPTGQLHYGFYLTLQAFFLGGGVLQIQNIQINALMLELLFGTF